MSDCNSFLWLATKVLNLRLLLLYLTLFNFLKGNLEEGRRSKKLVLMKIEKGSECNGVRK